MGQSTTTGFVQMYQPNPYQGYTQQQTYNFDHLAQNAVLQYIQTQPPIPMPFLKGEGYLVLPTDPGKIAIAQHVVEIADADAAQEAAVGMLDSYGAIVIYQAVGIVRPKKDYVLKLSKAGESFRAALEKADKTLPTGEVVAAE